MHVHALQKRLFHGANFRSLQLTTIGCLVRQGLLTQLRCTAKALNTGTALHWLVGPGRATSLTLALRTAGSEGLPLQAAHLLMCGQG